MYNLQKEKKEKKATNFFFYDGLCIKTPLNSHKRAEYYLNDNFCATSLFISQE